MKQTILLWLTCAIVNLSPMCCALAGLEGMTRGDLNAAGDASLNQDKPAPIPLDQIGTVAGRQYSGDGLSVTATADGARLRCVFQKLEGKATREGLWLTSTAEGAKGNCFQLMAVSVGRTSPPAAEAEGLASTMHFKTELPNAGSHDVNKLPRAGQVEVADQVARFVRPGLTEEYRVSMDGVRQDFVVWERPKGAGQLRLELDLAGAKAEQLMNGARLALDDSERKINYNRLRVTDAIGKELTAKMVVEENTRLSILLNDTAATYPVRIDPTFSDANWISIGGLPGANGTIYAAVVDQAGNLYIGGNFTIAGDVIASRIAKWDGSAWSALGSGVGGGYFAEGYYHPDNTVYALAVSGTDLYAGGDFTTAGGAPANCIAKWDGSTWSPLGDGMGGNPWWSSNPYVLALVVSGTDLYAGGWFWSAGGVTTPSIAKWNGSAWSCLGAGIDGQVKALAVSGAKLYAGGDFTTAGGVPANYIAKWDGSTWSALGSGVGGDYWSYAFVSALAVSGTDLYAGGSFLTAGGVMATNIAKWDGSAWSALGNGIPYQWQSPTVSALAVSGNSLYAGGNFATAGGVTANCIAKWDGTTWSALGEGMGNTVNALAVSGVNLFAGGDFSLPNRVGANIAIWNGSTWSALGNGMNRNVSALALSGTDLYAGGNFNITTAAGVTANCVAKWDGSTWSALGLGIGGRVYALAVSGTNLYAGGSFRTAGGVAANNIAKWNGSTWSALGEGINSYSFGGLYVAALVASGTNLYAGGSFGTAGGLTANNVARWDGNAWSALGSGIGDWDAAGGVHALALLGTNLYAGGRFVSPAGFLAKWDGKAWSAVGQGIGSCIAYGDVLALAVSGKNLYAGGKFTTAGGLPANNIAMWNGSAWSALGSGISAAVSQTYGGVFALAVSDSDVYAGGEFTAAGDVAANNIAKWNGSLWSALGSGTDGSVSALAVSGTSLFAGGRFLTAGGKLSPYLARADLAQVTPAITSHPANRTNNLYTTATFTVTATGRMPLSYSWRKNDTNNLSDGGNISGTGTAALTISNVQFGNAGNYSVVVSNAYGAVASSKALLTVLDLLPPGLSITSHLDLQIVRTNRIVLSGTASDAGRGDNGISSLTVNGARLTNVTAVADQTVPWSAAVSLPGVTNPINVVARDGRGNATTNIIRIIADTSAPTLAITSPTAGQRSYNPMFPVTGTARDNVGVSNVWVQLNGGAWTNATSTNGWTNWTALGELLVGTNTVRAYAEDYIGNRSAVTNRSLVYVVSDRLVLRTNPPAGGSVSGVTNGQWLDINVNYTATAKSNGTAGFVFQCWAQTTNRVNWLTSTVPVLNFTMQSNLELVACFTDVRRPTNSIIAPAVSASPLTNGLVTVQVRATDNVGVSSVRFYLNARYFGAGLALGSNLWVMDFALPVGTNVVQTVASDTSGNLSATNSIRLVYVNRQTNANAINIEEHWMSDYIPGPPGIGIARIQDTSTLTAALKVQGLQSLSEDAWSHLLLRLSFGYLSFESYLYGADLLTTNKAVFCYTDPKDASENPAPIAELTFSRMGDVLGVALRMGGPAYLEQVSLAGDYWPYGGTNAIQDQQPFAFSVQDGATKDSYADFATTIYLLGSGTETYNAQAGYYVWRTQVSGTADFISPTNTITAPVNGQRWSDAVFTVKGNARDNRQVSNVWFQINETSWQLAATTNSWTNWTAFVTLISGTNIVRAYAVDASGNRSKTNTVSFVSSSAFRLNLGLSSAHPLTSGGLELSIELSTGLGYRIEASSNLTDWTTVTNSVGTGTATLFRDLSATKYARRFYRVVVP